MASLQDILEEASARKAYELVMESGQPVVLTTSQGPESLGGVLKEADLIDALTSVLDEEQQVELAVGNLIEFQLDTRGGRWTLVAEPVADGVLVRARLRGAPVKAASARGDALDLPPLDPFTPPPTGEPLGAPGPGDDASRATRQTVEDLPVGLGRRDEEPPSQHAASALDLDVSVDLDEPVSGNTLGGAGVGPPPHVGSGAREKENPAPFLDFDFGTPITAPDAKSDATLFSPAGGPAPIPTMGPAEPLRRLGAEKLGFGAPDPAPRSRELHGTLIMGSNAPRLEDDDVGASDDDLGIPDDDDEDDASFADLSMDLEEEEAPSFPPPLSSGTVPKARDSHAAPMAPPPPLSFHGATEGLEELAHSIEPGTLCFVHGGGVAEELAVHIGVPHAVVEDGPAGTSAVEDLLARGREPGTVVVRTEDPSAFLGFLLRRLEEGWRVLVETRARTAEGARRILLGVDATAAAEAWLDAQVTSWALLEDGSWKLL